MPTYLALLGNTPELSRLELERVLGNTVDMLGAGAATFELDTDNTAQSLLNILGGTSKILLLHESATDTSVEGVFATVLKTLTEVAVTQNNSVDFALAEMGRDHLPPLDLAEMKQALKVNGVRSRYVEQTRRGLSAASYKNNNHIVEIFCIQTELGVTIAQTVAVQDVDDWAERDRQKPFAEHKRGLLPPKVARMMVNIALGDYAKKIWLASETSTTQDQKPVLLDPFCGAGTVLFEALLLGCDVIGSDIDTEAVVGTQKNVEWFHGVYPNTQELKVSILQSDATTLDLPKNSISHLVTEPFLGKPKPLPEQLPNIYRGLERMYLGAFKQWRQFLVSGATLVVVFPQVEMTDEHGRTRKYSLEHLIDKLADFGYTTTSGAVRYARPDATVQRMIYQFTYVAR